MRYYSNSTFSVERDADVICINKLNHARVVSDFIREINDGIKKDTMTSKLIFQK